MCTAMERGEGMIRIKVFKWTQLIYYVVVIALAILIIGLAVHAIGQASSSQPQEAPTFQAMGVVVVQEVQGVTAPALQGQAASRSDTQRPAVQANPVTLPHLFVPVGEDGQAQYQAMERSTFLLDTEGHDAQAIVLPPHIQIEIQAIQQEQSQQDYRPAVATGEGWRVAFYHTHSREAYAQDPQHPYQETETWRSADTNFNILAVGERATTLLNEYGIATVQDRTDHEPPRHGTAYVRSLETARRLVEENPPMQLMIDMHRDAYIEGEPRAVDVNGVSMAPMLFVIGTGEGSGENTFSEKPNWQENYKLALALTEQINQIAPGLCKPPSVRTGRYNQHVSESAVLVEIGHNENALDEAMRSGEVLAQAIAKVLGTEQ